MKRYAPPAVPVKLPGPLPFAAAAAFGLAAAWSARGLSGGLLPLDDAYIYMQYGRLFAAGHPFQYAAGEPLTTGATSLAWLVVVTVCTLGAALCSVAVETPMFLVEGLLLGAVLWLFLRLAVARGVPLIVAGFAALLLPAMPLWLFGALNGMETLLYGAGLLLIVAVLGGASPWWLLVPAFARPAGVLLVLGVIAILWFRRRSARGPLLAVVGVVLLAAAWPWLLTGRESLTWTAKSLPVEPRPDIRAFHVPNAPYFALRALWFGLSGARAQPPLGVLGDVLKPAAWVAWVWVVFLGGGLALAFRNGRGRIGALLWAVATLECLLTVAWDGQDYRYLVAPLPLLVLTAAVGWCGAGGGRLRLCALPVCACLAVATLFPEPAWVRFAALYTARSRDLAVSQVAAGSWIDGHLDPAARVAVHDAGALAYFGRRPVVDLVGLVTPELSLARRNGEGAVWEALSEVPASRRPTHAAFVNDWLPRLAKTYLFDRRLMTTRGGGGRVAFEVWSLSWPAGDAARWPGGDLSDVPAGYGPGAGQAALAIVDRVDMASLASERAHGCAFTPAGDPHDPLSVVRDLGFEPGLAMPGVHAMDGGRYLAGSVRFRLRARAGAPALLVLRSASAREAVLTVTVGDHEETLVVPRGETLFHEADVLIPADVITREVGRDGTVLVKIEGGRHLAFHWWILQPAASP